MRRTFLPPRTAIQCIDDAIVLSRRHFWPLLRLALIPVLAYAAIVYASYSLRLSYGIRLLSGLVWYGLYGFVEAATVAGSWDVMHGRPVDAAAIWRRVFERFFTLLFANWIRIYLIFLGLVVLIAPGLYFLAIYFGVPAVIMVEELGVGASLKRSRSLAMGSMRGILLSIGVAWLIATIVAYFIPRILILAGIPFVSPLQVLFSFGWVVVIIPFRSALAARVYLEIRVRKEGYDLQRLMGSLPDGAAPAPAWDELRP